MQIELSEFELRALYVALLTSETVLLPKKRTKALVEKIKNAVRESKINQPKQK